MVYAQSAVPWHVASSPNIGLTLLQALTSQRLAENIFISPPCIALLMQILLQQQDDELREAFSRRVAGMEWSEFNEAASFWRRTLRSSDPQVTLHMATSVWIEFGSSIDPRYLVQVSKEFESDVFEVDFSPRETVDRLNNWIASATHGKISNVVEAIDPSTVFAGITAAYFRGTWSRPFPAEETHDRVFTRSDGSQMLLPFMRSSKSLRYGDSAEYQAVALPYKQGRFAMYVFRPKRRSVTDFAERLCRAAWEDMLSNFTYKDGELVLPRFKIQYKADLREILLKMGLQRLFLPIPVQAGAAGVPISIGELKHHSFLEVSEEATEAAAATIAFEFWGAERKDPEPFQMVVDVPFLCLIRDELNGTIVFIGVIEKPG